MIYKENLSKTKRSLQKSKLNDFNYFFIEEYVKIILKKWTNH